MIYYTSVAEGLCVYCFCGAQKCDPQVRVPTSSYYIIPIIIIRLVVPLFAKLQLSGRIAAGSSKQLSIRVEIG
jgi:hypothetical protein